MNAMRSRLVFKTRGLAVVVILANVLGNFFLSRGLREGEASSWFSPLTYLRAFLNPWVVLGVSLLILWMLSRMTLLSWADLSYVLPVTALGYVLTALMGRIFLAEHVSVGRWAGIGLIICGVSLVGNTPVRTTKGRRGRKPDA
jgi:drug/metabolite transporter (DMT)-like permease